MNKYKKIVKDICKNLDINYFKIEYKSESENVVDFYVRMNDGDYTYSYYFLIGEAPRCSLHLKIDKANDCIFRNVYYKLDDFKLTLETVMKLLLCRDNY
jgi:hypothetical protein